jgi:hypothetical protein
MASNAEVHKILGSRCLTFSMPNAPGNYENPTPEIGLDIKERLVAWRGKMMDAPLPDIQPMEGILYCSPKFGPGIKIVWRGPSEDIGGQTDVTA